MNGLFRAMSDRGLGSTAIAMAVIASIAGSLSCSLIRLDPVTAEQRKVTAAADEAKTITLSEPIVWLNAPAHRASKAVRLPQGRYTLEAEDEEYLYFRAPSAIEMRLLEQGRPIEGPDIPGGLALGKAFFPATSPAAYIDVDTDHKMLVMKLGYDFMQMRGKQWEQSF
jgi:hypothetical protein